MAIVVDTALNPQLALGVFSALAGFDYAERETTVASLFNRVHPSLVNEQFVLLREENTDNYLAAAAWYTCAPVYAAIVLNENRPVTAAEARSGDLVIWHTMLAPYGATDEIKSLLRAEIIKITKIPNDQTLYQTFANVTKNYNLIGLKRKANP